MRKSALICLALAGATLVCAAHLQAQQNPAAEKAAQQSANTWLSGIDAGKYAESWTSAGDLFKKAVTKDKWVVMAKQARDPLGKVKSRKLKLAQYSKVPQGEVVTVQFNTEFAKKPGAVETVAEILGNDGKWHAAGYYIK
jgi:hypothetical protein